VIIAADLIVRAPRRLADRAGVPRERRFPAAPRRVSVAATFGAHGSGCDILCDIKNCMLNYNFHSRR
jgi:hypothetical protein